MFQRRPRAVTDIPLLQHGTRRMGSLLPCVAGLGRDDDAGGMNTLPVALLYSVLDFVDFPACNNLEVGGSAVDYAVGVLAAGGVDGSEVDAGSLLLENPGGVYLLLQGIRLPSLLRAVPRPLQIPQVTSVDKSEGEVVKPVLPGERLHVLEDAVLRGAERHRQGHAPPALGVKRVSAESRLGLEAVFLQGGEGRVLWSYAQARKLRAPNSLYAGAALVVVRRIAVGSPEWMVVREYHSVRGAAGEQMPADGACPGVVYDKEADCRRGIIGERTELSGGVRALGVGAVDVLPVARTTSLQQ